MFICSDYFDDYLLCKNFHRNRSEQEKRRIIVLGISWQYDAAGNRTTTTYKRATVEAPNTVATTTTIAAVFTGNDWLKQQTSTVATAGTTNATTTFYGYDRNGAQTHERVGAAGSVEVNDWQFDGTLAETKTQGQATGGSEFVYDVSGNRLKQRHYGFESLPLPRFVRFHRSVWLWSSFQIFLSNDRF